MPKIERARRVCEKCHISKVKCSGYKDGIPCTRCHRLSTDCLPFASLKVRRSPSVLSPLSDISAISPLSEQKDKIENILSRSSVASVLPTSRSFINGEITEESHESVDGSDMEWASVIDYFLKHRKETIDKRSITFFGESSPLTSLIRSLKESGHVSIQQTSENVAESKESLVQSNNEFLASRGAFTLPEKPVLEEMLSVYFLNIHPFYPIFNRRWFDSLYKKNQISPLLMNSICLVACSHCPISTIFRANFSSRKQAKHEFYHRAKLLFDFNYEKDRLTVLQSAFFLSFWCGSPNDVWNSRTWLGVAANIAEDLGMHRSTVNSNMSDSDKSLLKVIWWCICNRDVMSALTFGRPPRIGPHQCDVPLLEVSDCEADADPDDLQMYGKWDIVQGYYLVELSKLNCLLRRVFDARYNPGSPQSMEMNWMHHSEFTSWRNALPKEIDWDEDKSSGSIFSMCLCLFFHHHITFIHRPLTSDMVSSENCSLDTSVESASQIALIGSRISTHSLMARVPQDAYATFVVAMVILALQSTTREDKNAITQLQLCKMVLQQGSSYWDHAGWLINVFNSISSDAMSKDRAPSMTSAASSTSVDILPATPSSSFLLNWLTEFCDQEYAQLFKNP